MDEGSKKMWNPPFIEYPNPTAYPDVALSVLSFVPNAYLEIPLLAVKHLSFYHLTPANITVIMVQIGRTVPWYSGEFEWLPTPFNCMQSCSVCPQGPNSRYIDLRKP